MLDIDACALAAECLAGAASEACSASDLQLTAVAFARDLADSGWAGDAGVQLLDAARAEAIRRLDASELDRGQFAAALHALAFLFHEVGATLIRVSGGDREAMAGHE